MSEQPHYLKKQGERPQWNRYCAAGAVTRYSDLEPYTGSFFGTQNQTRATHVDDEPSLTASDASLMSEYMNILSV